MPWGIAVDARGYIYIADLGNYRIQKFTSTGTYVTQWGSQGMGNNQFEGPAGIALDKNGNIYVTNTLTPSGDRIEEFTSTGTYVTQWGSYGTGNGQFWYPFGIAIDTNGNIYVADTSNNRIEEFTSTGTYVTQWGSYGTGSGQFNAPWGIAVDESGNVYVADWGNYRIQEFSPSSGTPQNVKSVGLFVPPSSSNTQSTYSVTYLECGLPSGTPWTVSLDGNQYTNSGNTITILNLKAGTYSWNANQVTAGWVPQLYCPMPASGSIQVPQQTTGPSSGTTCSGIVYSSALCPTTSTTIPAQPMYTLSGFLLPDKSNGNYDLELDIIPPNTMPSGNFIAMDMSDAASFKQNLINQLESAGFSIPQNEPTTSNVAVIPASFAGEDFINNMGQLFSVAQTIQGEFSNVNDFGSIQGTSLTTAEALALTDPMSDPFKTLSELNNNELNEDYQQFRTAGSEVGESSIFNLPPGIMENILNGDTTNPYSPDFVVGPAQKITFIIPDIQVPSSFPASFTVRGKYEALPYLASQPVPSTISNNQYYNFNSYSFESTVTINNNPWYGFGLGRIFGQSQYTINFN